MFLGLALVAGAVEAGVGYPDVVYRAIGHPVTWLGRLIAWADARWNSQQDPPAQQRSQGIALVVTLLAISLFAGLLISQFFHSFLPSFLALVPIAILTSSLLAQRSLYDHVDAVAAGLDQSLDRGRQAVSMIVGRDTGELSESDVCRAAIESLAESFSDGVVAPMFWLTVAGLSGGIAYKAVNTADSMIGHKTEKYIDFGWAAARTDDVLNWLPARLSVLWLVLAAVVVPGTSPWRALTVVRRDARLHDSPNAGWPEAAMAGALGVRLMGPRTYDGEPVNKGWMGDGRVFIRISDVRTALRLYRVACGIQLGVLAILFVLTFFW
ncbi:adenosylcobinamide-phosphate synthase CbiB [Reyranella sp.]|uniref:adenosylcobinamide-phosphate synthase CbiB n=1 Tax=Reyranella sp. TaxID=1929291 RepID=UPI003D0CBB48